MTGSSHILGVILAGGRARRLFQQSPDGGDKGFADLGGQPMLAHVIGRFQPQVASLILNANGDPARFARFGLRVVPDLDSTEQGPLAGLLAGMTWAETADSAFSAIVTVTTDVPFLPLDLVAQLAVATRNGPAIAASADRRHPTIGLWPLSLKGAVQAALSRHELSVNAFAEAHGAIAVSFPFSDGIGGEGHGVRVDPFFNANTPAELKEARALLTRKT